MELNQMMMALKSILALTGSLLAAFFGGWDATLYTLLIFILFDYLTGVVRAAYERKVSSSVGFWGILKKVMVLLIVGLSHLLDVNLLGGGQVLRTGVIFFYSANEGISITENLGAMGFPIPRKLRKVLLQIKEEEDG
ncbi:phage holin family protein [Eubacteriaceae bacterium ES3]|nr:phage holin family protein [Eubacteriaceae bacterium ES3]